MIRLAKATDLVAIREINADAIGYDLPIDQTKKQYARCLQAGGHHILVYEDAEHQAVQGYIHAQVYESLYSDRGLNILALAVLPNAQGKGVGSALIQALEDLALEHGYAFIRLNSAEHRYQAHVFYENKGYQSDKLQKRFIKHL